MGGISYICMIVLEDIKKSYNGEEVLKGVCLQVEKGSFVSVMGESGSGKSTLLNVLGGFIAPDEGRVLWNGEDIFAFSERRRSHFRSAEMGFVFQSFRLAETLTAIENALLPAMIAGSDPARARARAEELFERLSLSAMAKKYPSELSGGQQQRAAIARALTSSPQTVILDEPTGALDSAMQIKVMELLRDENSLGRTIIQVTHNPAMAKYGQRTIKIRDGMICG